MIFKIMKSIDKSSKFRKENIHVFSVFEQRVQMKY